MLSGDLWLLWAALLLVTEQGKCSSFLPHHCPHQLCDGEAQKGIPTRRKEAEAEFPSAEDPLAHIWPVSSTSSSCLLTWSFPPAHGDDKLFQPRGVPKATPVPSAWGCQGCLRQGWGLCELQSPPCSTRGAHHTLAAPAAPGRDLWLSSHIPVEQRP